MRLSGLLRSVVLCILVLTGNAQAQTVEPDAPEFQPAAELVAPSVSTEEFAHRLIPLSRDELLPLSAAWLEIVKSATKDISDRQVALIRDPTLATQAGYSEIAQMTEERTVLFERYSMVVDALESKGMLLVKDHAMPANNRLLVWKKLSASTR